MGTSILRFLQGALIGAVIVYASDWGLLQYRIAHGTGYGQVQVNQFLGTPLKGNKEEYDLMGQIQRSCVRSLLPEPEGVPCWWLEKHQNEWE